MAQISKNITQGTNSEKSTSEIKSREDEIVQQFTLYVAMRLVSLTTKPVLRPYKTHQRYWGGHRLLGGVLKTQNRLFLTHGTTHSAKIFGYEAPENGAKGAVLENFLRFFEKLLLRNAIKSENLGVWG